MYVVDFYVLYVFVLVFDDYVVVEYECEWVVVIFV